MEETYAAGSKLVDAKHQLLHATGGVQLLQTSGFSLLLLYYNNSYV